jgi:hypothetical protein
MEISNIFGWHFIYGYVENTKTVGPVSTQNWGYPESFLRGMNINEDVSGSAWNNNRKPGKGRIGGNEAAGGLMESGSGHAFLILYA